MSEDTLKALAEKLGVLETAEDAKRLEGRTFLEVIQYLAENATAMNALGLGGVSAEELLTALRDPAGRALDADRLGGRTLEDVLNEVKNRIREANHPYMVVPLSKGGWSRLVTIPANYSSEYESNQTTNEDLLFLLIGGGPYGFLAERPVAYLRIGREGRPPVVNVLSGRYTVDFYYRKVRDEHGSENTEIWCGDAARNDFQLILLGGLRGCKFGVKERPLQEQPEGTLVPIRREAVVKQSYLEQVVADLRAEINEVKSEIETLKP